MLYTFYLFHHYYFFLHLICNILFESKTNSSSKDLSTLSKI